MLIQPKKCYISGKITGLSTEEYMQNFAAAEKYVFELGFHPVNPTKLQHNHDKSWEQYMKEDLKALLDCSYIYCLKNWTASKGATIEILLATSLGLIIVE